MNTTDKLVDMQAELGRLQARLALKETLDESRLSDGAKIALREQYRTEIEQTGSIDLGKLSDDVEAAEAEEDATSPWADRARESARLWSAYDRLGIPHP